MNPVHDYTYKVHTFGCKVNTYDAGLVQKNMEHQGFTKAEKSINPRIHVLNTCAVTAEATKEAVRYVRRLKSKDPFCTIVVTGCAAQVDTEKFSELPGADLVVANSHKNDLPNILRKYFSGALKEKVLKSNIFKKDDLEMGGGIEASHTRGFLKIQDGCNSFCSYCIIPYARGKSRSIPIKNLVDRVNELYKYGMREIVLTGVHIGDYEADGDKKLYNLVESLLEKTSMPRFRLSSLEPVELSGDLMSLFENKRMCPHFHMSIQSANTEVLKDMKRNYSQKEVIESLTMIQKKVPGAFVGMDVIVGFPTETDENFLDTYSALEISPWTKIHVFPYSERNGTRAAELMTRTVRWEERLIRAKKLRALSALRYESQAMSQIGKQKKVLILNESARGGHGLSEDYWPIKILDSESFLSHWKGQEIVAKIVGYESIGQNQMDGCLRAEVS